MKKLIELEATERANNLEVRVEYDLGGVNYFTGGFVQRGYYLSVTPVLIRESSRTARAFTGVSSLLLPVQRKSEKAYKEACELAKKKEQKLISYVLDKNDLELKVK